MRHSVEKNTLLVCQRGLTLVELIVSMVIISIALGGVLMVMNFTVSHSADPMIQHQAVAIAEAYMEEILLQGYDDPGGGTESGRVDFDDVDDYDKDNASGNGIDNQSPPENQKGMPIGVLSGYTVTVDVEDDTLNAVAAKKITVTVNHSVMGDMSLVGYRTDY
jgi:MSHA pilin protein MshD